MMHVGEQVGKNLSISTENPDVLDIKESVLLILFQFFFSSQRNGSGWALKVIDESLPATGPSPHSGFSKGRPCLHVMIIII